MYGFNSNMGNPYSYYPNNSFPMMNGISNNPMYSYYPNMNTMPSASMPPGAGGMPSPMQPQQALPSPGTMAGMYYNSNNTPSQPYSMATANQSNTPGMPPGGVPQTMSSGSGTGGGMMRGFSSNQQETGDRGSGGGGGGQYNTTPYDPNLAQEQRRIDEGARWAEQLRRQQENWARNNT
ncbi:hypothetical protein CSUI_002120 [Cystoisospora suis]|uniref:Uncharacterized protein n=1 Tax=Cystoisospora suis TaxID=483139 RepID=A0A2C6L5Y1_9APIC|nr:hypothetical protein CSUI_002120 [Cystoisospora suis]